MKDVGSSKPIGSNLIVYFERFCIDNITSVNEWCPNELSVDGFT